MLVRLWNKLGFSCKLLVGMQKMVQSSKGNYKQGEKKAFRMGKNNSK